MSSGREMFGQSALLISYFVVRLLTSAATLSTDQSANVAAVIVVSFRRQGTRPGDIAMAGGVDRVGGFAEDPARAVVTLAQ